MLGAWSDLVSKPCYEVYFDIQFKFRSNNTQQLTSDKWGSPIDSVPKLAVWQLSSKVKDKNVLFYRENKFVDSRSSQASIRSSYSDFFEYACSFWYPNLSKRLIKIKKFKLRKTDSFVFAFNYTRELTFLTTINPEVFKY